MRTVPDGYLDAGPIREHVLNLLTHPGVTRANITRVAGLDSGQSALHYLLNSQQWISPAKANALLAVTADAALAHDTGLVVDAEPVVARIRYLLTVEAGSISAIADATGLDYETIAAIAAGERANVTVATAKYVLAVAPADLWRSASAVPKRRAVTMLRALQANGWPLEWCADQLGTPTSQAPQFIYQRSDLIAQATHRRVKALYDRIGDRVGPSNSARIRGKKSGYYPPICYDEDMRLIEVPAVEEEDNDMKYRLKLCILGMAAYESTSPQIAHTHDTYTRLIERVCARIKLRRRHDQKANASFLLPGQDAKVALIRAHTAGIVIHQRTDAWDTITGTYHELWRSLCVEIASLRATLEEAAA